MPAPTLEFQLPTMSCGHCVKAITAAVQAVDPQARLNIDLPTRRVEVQTEAPRAVLAAALAEAGYEEAGAA